MMQKNLFSLLFLALTSVVFAAPVKLSDAEGKTVEIKDISRVITLGGSVTEIAFALGAGKNVVAADTSSYFPAAVNKLPKVGYQRRLSAEGLIALKPTLVIGTTSTGPATAIAQLRDAGVQVLILSEQHSPEGTKAKIKAMAKVFGKEVKGQTLTASLNRDLIKARSVRLVNKPKVMFIYARGPQGAQISGSGTGASAMIKLAGGVNAIQGVEGYKPLTAEAAVAAAPDVILMLGRGLQSVGGPKGLAKMPGIAQTPAARNGRIVALDDLYLLGFGPRLGQAVADLRKEFGEAMASE